MLLATQPRCGCVKPQASAVSAQLITAHRSVMPRPRQRQELHTFSQSAQHSRSRRGRLQGSVVAAAVNIPEIYKEGVNLEVTAFQNHQKTAAKPSAAEYARTLMALAQFGVLSTVSSHPNSAGYPSGSLVEFVADAEGRPLLTISTLAPHTADLQADARCSITVVAPGFKGLADGRFTLTGTAKPLPEADRPAARELFVAKYPNAFYIDFADFSWLRIEDVRSGRWVGGFGGGTHIKGEDYSAAKPDPVASFAPHVAGHMNSENSHVQDMKDMVQHYIGLSVCDAKMLDMDRLGITLQCTRQQQSFQVRLPFIKPADDRKAVKEVLVEMTKSARAAVSKKAE